MPKAGKSDAGSWNEKSGSVGAALEVFVRCTFGFLMKPV
jgi:hypothetical protein